MLLLPGSLPPDRATLTALCDGMAAFPEIASRLLGATDEEFSGSWSDVERAVSCDARDLIDGSALALQARPDNQEAVSVAIATPFHAALGLTDLTPADPSTLSLSAEESRALCEAADAHMREDGLRVHFVDAARWLFTCNQAVEVLTERPEWIVSELLRPNLPRGRDARLVERWMNELQMLLHAHPVNIAREERGLPPVNLVWLWGFGALDANKNNDFVGAALPRPTSDVRSNGGGRAVPTEPPLHLAHLDALRNGNVPAWQTAWQTCAPEILSANTIFLGGSRPRLRLTATRPSVTTRLLSTFKRKATLSEALTKLQQSR